MSDNVLEFKPRKFELVYECDECEGQLFLLVETMRIHCDGCGLKLDNLFITEENPDADE